MKRTVLFAQMVFLSIICFSQAEKGDWLVGGTFEINTAENNNTISFNPDAGYFVINNLAIGGQLNFTFDKLGDNKFTIFGIGPFTRYYFGDKKFRPFLHGDMRYESRRLKTSQGSSTESGFGYFIGGGGALFINENVALEGLLGYDHTSVEKDEGSGGFNLKIGFQVYINRHQVARITER